MNYFYDFFNFFKIIYITNSYNHSYNFIQIKLHKSALS